MKFFLAAVALLVVVCAPVVAQTTPVEKVRSADVAAPGKTTRRALIISGLPGDEVYEEQFTQSVTEIRTSLIERFGFAEGNIRVQFARPYDDDDDVATQQTSKDPKDEEQLSFLIAGNATREEIAAEAKRLRAAVQENDVTWVFVIGQAYYDGRNVFLNVPDTDLNHKQFGSLFAKLKGQSTFFISTPASGFYIKPLSKKNRVVITSASADAETNGSVFHQALARTMTEITSAEESDIDGNGNASVLDLYIKTVQNMTDIYYENETPLIPTEHPLLDDDGDGRGSELQIDYLTMAQGGRSDSKRKRRLRKFKDGKFAAALALSIK